MYRDAPDPIARDGEQPIDHRRHDRRHAHLADALRRGIGTALTLQPLLDARESGFRTGVLQAAAAGVGVYTRLGFRRFGEITEYKPPAEGAIGD